MGATWIIEAEKSFCILSKFLINDKKADMDDFITQSDEDEAHAEEYCCANMVGRPKLPTQGVLDKYNITLEEYGKVATEAAKAVSFGSCSLCC